MEKEPVYASFFKGGGRRSLTEDYYRRYAVAERRVRDAAPYGCSAGDAGLRLLGRVTLRYAC